VARKIGDPSNPKILGDLGDGRSGCAEFLSEDKFVVHDGEGGLIPESKLSAIVTATIMKTYKSTPVLRPLPIKVAMLTVIHAKQNPRKWIAATVAAASGAFAAAYYLLS
jgi:hypothetical protein